MRVLLSALLLLLACGSAPAQDARRLEFDVASVRPAGRAGLTGLTVYPGGRVAIPRASLKSLITTAFRISYFQISGGEDWTEDEYYAIEARAPGELQSQIANVRYTWYGIENDQLRETLQSLLIDRFQLTFHRETKTDTVYTLERRGRELALRPSERASRTDGAPVSDAFANIGYAGGRWVIGGVSMPRLAKFAGDYYLHVPVEDRTGLAGLFDYRQPEPDPDPNFADNTDSFLRMIDALGLQLRRAEGLVETFVIDSAARPSPN